MKAVIPVLAVLSLFAAEARAQSDPGRETGDQAMPAVARQSPAEVRSDTLDRLFGRLVKSTSDEESQIIERSIWKLWMTSDSPTAELLLGQAVKASAAGNNDVALAILNGVLEVHPDFTEAWNRRATVHFIMGRYKESLADIDQVLDREPRHFGALSGLGMIKRKMGDLAGARAAFSEALAVNPHLESVERALKDIEKEERPI